MSNKVYEALIYSEYDVVTTLIQHGHSRPSEREVQAMVRGRNESNVRYLASLGLPIIHCDEYTVKVFPELLDLLKDPVEKHKQVFLDITQCVNVSFSSNLVKFAIDTRPDLYDSLRKVVIGKDYVDLFDRFDVRPEELSIQSRIVYRDMDFLKAYAEKHNTTLEIFYPLVFCRGLPNLFKKFDCDSLIQYSLDRWKDLERTAKGFILDLMPEKTVAKCFLLDFGAVRTSNIRYLRDDYYQLAILYWKIPEIRESVATLLIHDLGNRIIELLPKAVEKIREKYI